MDVKGEAQFEKLSLTLASFTWSDATPWGVLPDGDAGVRGRLPCRPQLARHQE